MAIVRAWGAGRGLAGWGGGEGGGGVRGVGLRVVAACAVVGVGAAVGERPGGARGVVGGVGRARRGRAGATSLRGGLIGGSGWWRAGGRPGGLLRGVAAGGWAGFGGVEQEEIVRLGYCCDSWGGVEAVNLRGLVLRGVVWGLRLGVVCPRLWVGRAVAVGGRLGGVGGSGQCAWAGRVVAEVGGVVCWCL